jgi:drug/metabolite transporter (DMT)-like permease
MISDRARGRLHLAIVGVVWGSTFLAIRIAVNPTDGFPPFLLCALRVAVAAVLLFSVAFFRRMPLVPSRRALVQLARSGVLLWGLGLGALLWASERAESGYAAVLFGAAPIFGLGFELVLRRTRIDPLRIVWMAIGFGGVLLLTLPSLIQGTGDVDAMTVLALVFAPLSWSLGSVLTGDEVKKLPLLVSAGHQQLFGAVACVVFSLLAGETWRAPSMRASIALGYMIVPGCIPAFTSYVRAIELLPASEALSFAYVNPVIAVGLGWAILDERLTVSIVAGMVLIAAGLLGIMRRDGRGG